MDVKKLTSSKYERFFTTEHISFQTLSVHSDVMVALTDLRKQTTYCDLLSKHTNNCSLRYNCKLGKGKDRVPKNARKNGKEQRSVPIKKSVSNKQHSLISLTTLTYKIQ